MLSTTIANQVPRKTALDNSKAEASRTRPTASVRNGDNGTAGPSGKPAATVRTKPKFANTAKVVPKPAASVVIDTTPASPGGKPTFEWRDVDDLKPFPLQSEFFVQESEADDALLEQDLRQNGQRDPFPVMPDHNRAGLPKGTMLDGHRRTLLLKTIGKKRAKVRVRHDLVDADLATVEAEFLKYNSLRRQLHSIDKARIAKRQFEIEKGRSRGGLRSCEDAEARERVGKTIGLCGRELQRYWRLLKTPLEVQNAVRNKLLPLSLGEKIEGLKKEHQARIAEQIPRLRA